MHGPKDISEFDDYLHELNSEDKEIPSNCNELIILLKSFCDILLLEQDGDLRFSIIESVLHSFEELQPNISVDEYGRVQPEIICGKANLRYEFTSECHFKSAIKARVFRNQLERLLRHLKSYDSRGRCLRFSGDSKNDSYYDAIDDQYQQCKLENGNIIYTITDILSHGERGFDYDKRLSKEKEDSHSTVFVSILVKKQLQWAK